MTAFTEISVSAYRGWVHWQRPHGDISQPQAGKHRPNAARCRRRQTHMARNVGKSGQKKRNKSVFYVSFALAPAFTKVGDTSAEDGTDAMTAGRLLGQFRISSAMHPYVLRLRLRLGF